LVIVSFLNVFAEPNPLILYGLYAVIFSSFIFILYNIPKFFRFSFHPGFAGLTFPLAIGTVASTSFSNYLINHELEGLGVLIKQLSGIELFLATAVIAFVCYNFLRMLIRSYQSAQNV
ncbi:transporter, partial [Turicibacter sanguinis]|nr:transporter [Turicibacter sanguinis]